MKKIFYTLTLALLATLSFTSCSDDDDNKTPETPTMAGTYSGKITLTIAGQYNYDADIQIVITENTDGSLNLTYPQYQLSETMMGDLTLGSYTIKNIAWDEAKNAYYRNYSDDGLKQHFQSTQGMNNDYPLGNLSEITITKTNDGGIKIVNPFKLGAMPLPISATFEGKK